mmetsp:Transcript_45449/g.83156  ORF Transcript_45449/g.83156 Transcript_45449/m.83156 type:complete len:234 (-) Transcript_45449:579-1280(-)
MATKGNRLPAATIAVRFSSTSGTAMPNIARAACVLPLRFALESISTSFVKVPADKMSKAPSKAGDSPGSKGSSLRVPKAAMTAAASACTSRSALFRRSTRGPPGSPTGTTMPPRLGTGMEVALICSDTSAGTLKAPDSAIAARPSVKSHSSPSSRIASKQVLRHGQDSISTRYGMARSRTMASFVSSLPAANLHNVAAASVANRVCQDVIEDSAVPALANVSIGPWPLASFGR